MLFSQLESLLFLSNKPLALKKLAQLTQVDIGKAREALHLLKIKYNQKNSGVNILENNDEFQMVSSPENSRICENMLKLEVAGELTQPQLEALTVIAYRGPITKPELEEIRGVNCSLILRNLLIRGLVEEIKKRSGYECYQISMDFLRWLGLSSVKELPEYEELSGQPG